MEVKFKQLKKKHKAIAEEFLEQLELLPIFLNYYGDIQKKWLGKLNLSLREIGAISQVIDLYDRKKIELENRLLPRTRKQVIHIENKVLKNMYIGRLLSTPDVNSKIIIAFIKEEFPDSVILSPEQLRKLELLTLFRENMKKFPVHYLVFDSESGKIIGYEITKMDEKGEKNGSKKRRRRKNK
jgi:hypothetical protein